jgi:hypothetical protein
LSDPAENADIIISQLQQAIEIMQSVADELHSFENENFDYTEWRQKNLVDMDLETLNREAAEYEKDHPFRGGKKND